MIQAQQRGQPAPAHAYYGPPTAIAYVALQPIAPVPAPKRPLETSPEDEPVPKKKSRAKKTNGETTSKVSLLMKTGLLNSSCFSPQRQHHGEDTTQRNVMKRPKSLHKMVQWCLNLSCVISVMLIKLTL